MVSFFEIGVAFCSGRNYILFLIHTDLGDVFFLIKFFISLVKDEHGIDF